MADQPAATPNPEATPAAPPPAVAAKPVRKPKPPEEPKIPIDLGLEKSWPWSEGLTNQRKKKPPLLAVINESCTGCAGSPVCITYCPVEECMYWVEDEDSPPFGRIEVDYQLCIGCKKCISKGPDDTFLDGCPWDAIDMVPTPEVEEKLEVKFNY